MTGKAQNILVTCPECSDRVKIELPEEGKTGTAKCRRGHILLFGYDGVTVTLLEVLTEALDA